MSYSLSKSSPPVASSCMFGLLSSGWAILISDDSDFSQPEELFSQKQKLLLFFHIFIMVNRKVKQKIGMTYT